MRRPSRLAVAAALAASLLLAGCSGGADPAPGASDAGAATPAPTQSAPATDAADTACEYLAAPGAVREVEVPVAENAPGGQIAAVMATSAGDIALNLDADRAPCTVASFVSLAEQGYYDDTQCHRLTTEGIFVLQCGDPSGTGRGGPGYRYADELSGSETYPAGTVAMANAGPDTNGSQFFLVYEDTPLPPAYTVFGVLEAPGIEIVRQVAAAGTDTGDRDGAPATPVTIESVTVR